MLHASLLFHVSRLSLWEDVMRHMQRCPRGDAWWVGRQDRKRFLSWGSTQGVAGTEDPEVPVRSRQRPRVWSTGPRGWGISCWCVPGGQAPAWAQDPHLKCEEETRSLPEILPFLKFDKSRHPVGHKLPVLKTHLSSLTALYFPRHREREVGVRTQGYFPGQGKGRC